MENLIPPSLIFIRDIRNALEDGSSLKQGIECFLSRGLECTFRTHLIQWWNARFQQGGVPFPQTTLPPHLQLLLELLDRGLGGDSIGGPLARLEDEVLRLAQDEIQREMDLMPFRFMIPTLLFFFPGLMALMIGPVLTEVLELLGGPV